MKNIELSAREARFIRACVPLASYTTFKIGGVADYYADVTTIEELREAFAFARANKLNTFVLGGGSNLLVSDEGYRGLMIHVNMQGIAQEKGTITVGAGNMLDDVVQYAVEHELWGIENLSSIPGTLGGAAVQNAGAYGVELASVIMSVGVYDVECDEVKKLSLEECRYGYRESIFKTEEGERYVILTVTLSLSETPKPQLSYRDLACTFPEGSTSLRDIRNAVIRIRAAKFPDLTKYGTAGSFFKNPVITSEQYKVLQQTYPTLPAYLLESGAVKIPIAWVLDTVLKLRGVQEGDVGAWETQPLVITNYGNATAQSVGEFADKIVQNVLSKTGVRIEREVIYVNI